jgi:nucleotide-binding universal stress UspA family protein
MNENITNILLALELKDTDAALLSYAKMLALKFDAKVWLVHVAAPEPDFVGYDVGPQYIRDNRAETLKEEHQALHQHLKDFEKEDVKCDALLVLGPTQDTLEKEVKKLKIDLMILGNHQHGFFYELFVGSTASSIPKSISIPILMVPIDEQA